MFDFKGLVNALLRRPNEDGVNDLKSATIWVQELPEGDIHQAQAEIIKTVASLNTNQKIQTRERIRTILYLDDKAQRLQESLCHNYLHDSAFGRHYLPTILSFWSEMASAYKTCLRNYAQKPVRGVAGDLPRVTARGIHYYAMLAKWAHIRYLPVDGRVWRNLHRFYLFAETEGFADSPIKLYSDSTYPTTCTQQYLHPMMLQLAAPESMLPPQIEQVDRWLDYWSDQLLLENQIRPHRQLFAINLEEPKPAKKLRRNMVDEKYRYWSTDALIERIEHTIEQIKEGVLPARLGLGENFRTPAGLDLLESVANRWSREGASVTRKHERTAKQKTVHVIQGLTDTIEQLSHPLRLRSKRKRISSASGNTGFEIIGPTVPVSPDSGPELFESNLLEWQIENESQYGIGAKFYSDFNIKLSIGELVGLRLDEQTRFAIGIVRRIQKNLDGQVHVGVETINQTPIMVKLYEEGDEQTAFDAIYLPEADQGVIPRCLLLDPNHYHPERNLLLKAQGKSFSIRLKNAIESNNDFARVRFGVLAKH